MSASQIIFTNLFFYLLGFSTLLVLRNKVSEQSSAFFSILINLIGVLFSLGLIIYSSPSEVVSFEWFSILDTSITFDLLLNNQTFLLYFIVQFIAFWVQLFSIKYMQNDSGFSRYFAFINLFVFSMLGIVVSGNLLLIYMFWELVGLSSYFLIGFWYQKPAASNAAKKAFLVNRIGDIGFLIGILLLYGLFNTFNLTSIITQTTAFFEEISTYSAMNQLTKQYALTIAGILVFAGCIGKSAQFPLQIWLPDAMQGPTPVSALIHAATMVAAGIFLMARVAPILTPTAGLVIASVGALTAFMGAYSAIFQNDIKKILAYSTISQLGLMVIAIGIGASNAALFHLSTHAFFKAGLFLNAGIIIHTMHHEQDIRKLRNLRKKLPIAFFTFGICGASLVGIPFFSGFLSKDAILIEAFHWAASKENDAYFIIPILAIITSVMTAFYISRLFIMLFIDPEEHTVESFVRPVKNTTSKFHKNFKAVLEGDNVELVDEEAVYSFVRKIGVMETAVLVMAFASFFFVFSYNPFSPHGGLFAKTFPINESADFHWIGYATLGLSLVSMLLSYTFTKEEIAKVKAGYIPAEPSFVLSRLGFHHFYLNEIYHIVFVETLVGISKKVYRFEEENEHAEHELVDYTFEQGGLSKWMNKFDTKFLDKIILAISDASIWLSNKIALIEQKIVDGAVRATSNIVKFIGDKTRQIQGGEIQLYILSLFVGVILFITLLMLL